MYRGERDRLTAAAVYLRARATLCLAGMSKVKILVKFNQTDQVIIEM